MRSNISVYSEKNHYYLSWSEELKKGDSNDMDKWNILRVKSVGVMDFQVTHADKNNRRSRRRFSYGNISLGKLLFFWINLLQPITFV